MSEGWIKLYRSSFNNSLYFSEPFTRWQAWVDMLLLANHDDGVITKRGVKIVVERGQIGYSEVSLAKRWGWSRDKVRRFLKYLEKGVEGNTAEFKKTIQQIRQQKTNTTTLITIVNYEKYQDTIQQTIHQSCEKRYLNKNRESNLIVKQTENFKKNGKEKINGGISSGEALYVARYGNRLPELVGNKKNDFKGEG